MEEMKTPITQEVWRKLERGDGIKDKYGRVWKITSRYPGNVDRLFARCPGHAEDRLEWSNGQIMDDEWAIMVELNHPSVTIV